MLKGLTKIFSKQNKDLRKRIYFTLFCLGFFALGINITIPWASEVYAELGFLEIFNLMSGGGLRSFSIFGMGVSPYITASIITQLLQMDIIPYFKELKEQGYVGRQKINKITRYLGILIAFVQAYVISIFYLNTNDVMVMLKTSLVMTAGTAFLLWLGDQISQKGIGNGQSLLILSGILISMPSVFTGAYSALITNATDMGLGITLFALFILSYILVIVGIIWIQLAERRIPIQYSNRTTSAYGAQQSFLPIKINSAGVMPVIFASVLTSIPATIVQLTKSEAAINFVNNYIVYTSPVGFLLYIILIFVFGYFYTFLSMNPEEMSKNLNKNGGYIPGVRPGEDTSNYISKSLSRLTMVGSLFLVILAGLPIVLSTFTDLPSNVTIGGTGVLIVVGVAIETYKQIESSLTARSYAAKKKRFR
ncbi:MAG: preprotein translocase subunit SecY [Bacilli bacterium]|nr:preprotein translocase subunit SecY [Bacilli bacterium]MCX4254598.1 preprotein translocase subunit SecY [Bacilli bacterium]